MYDEDYEDDELSGMEDEQLMAEYRELMATPQHLYGDALERVYRLELELENRNFHSFLRSFD